MSDRKTKKEIKKETKRETKRELKKSGAHDLVKAALAKFMTEELLPLAAENDLCMCCVAKEFTILTAELSTILYDGIIEKVSGPEGSK